MASTQKAKAMAQGKTLHQQAPPATGDRAMRPHQSPNPVRSFTHASNAFMMEPETISVSVYPWASLAGVPTPKL